MNYNNIEVGNLVRYLGIISKYNNRIIKIESIDKIGKGISYKAKVIEDDTIIKVYNEDIIHVVLDYEILEKLGFRKKDVSGINCYEMNDRVYVNIAIIYPKMIDFKGIQVTTCDYLRSKLTEDTINENCISLRYLNSLQNYLNDMGENKDINFEIIK